MATNLDKPIKSFNDLQDKPSIPSTTGDLADYDTTTDSRINDLIKTILHSQIVNIPDIAFNDPAAPTKAEFIAAYDAIPVTSRYPTMILRGIASPDHAYLFDQSGNPILFSEPVNTTNATGGGDGGGATDQICDADGDTCFDTGVGDSDIARVRSGGVEMLRWFSPNNNSERAMVGGFPINGGSVNVQFGEPVNSLPNLPFGIGNPNANIQGINLQQVRGDNRSGFFTIRDWAGIYQGDVVNRDQDNFFAGVIAGIGYIRSDRRSSGGEEVGFELRDNGLLIRPGDNSQGSIYRVLTTHPSKSPQPGIASMRRPIQAEQYTRVFSDQAITGTPTVPQTLNLNVEIQGPSSYATSFWLNVVGGNNFEITDTGRYKFTYNINFESIGIPTEYNEFKVYLFDTKSNTVILDSSSFFAIHANQRKCSVNWDVIRSSAPVSSQPNVEIRIEQLVGSNSIKTMSPLASAGGLGGRFIIDKLCGN